LHAQFSKQLRDRRSSSNFASLSVEYDLQFRSPISQVRARPYRIDSLRQGKP
jgi:hypothetical protein